jgi:hypothetical protein
MHRLRSLSHSRPARAALLALLLGVSVAGCGPGKGEVSGTVRYKGRPLSSGTIQFLGPDGVPCAATIQPDGSFAAQVTAGEAKVIVSCVDEPRLTGLTKQLAAGGPGRAAPPRVPSGGNFSLIPLRYGDWDASGLTVLVDRGGTRQDFDLPPN